MSSVLLGVDDESFRVSWESSAVRAEMLEVNFSGSRTTGRAGLEGVEPIVGGREMCGEKGL